MYNGYMIVCNKYLNEKVPQIPCVRFVAFQFHYRTVPLICIPFESSFQLRKVLLSASVENPHFEPIAFYVQVH